MFNMVGFQTRMKWSEQKRIFRTLPGLENAEFLRFGVIHKNIYLDFPKIIDKENYYLKGYENLYFAGQITGVEGYMESAASGLFTAYSLWAGLSNKQKYFPQDTMIGALQKYTITDNDNYQPMASNFGLLNKERIYDERGKKIKGREKKFKLSEESLNVLKKFKEKFYKFYLSVLFEY